MEEWFGVAAFRSRQQVQAFAQLLRRAGVPSGIVTTPRSISVGCGLSVRFRLEDSDDVLDVYRHHQPGNLIGFCRVHVDVQGRVEVVPLGVQHESSHRADHY